MSYFETENDGRLSLTRKVIELNWGLVFVVCVTASFGFAMLYSAAGGNIEPWASRQMVRFAAGLVVMLVVALIDIRLWLRLAYPFYGLAIVLLVVVEHFGVVGMGAQRWISFGVIQLQPSEVMKIALVAALARYFHGLSAVEIGQLRRLIVPLALIAAPACCSQERAARLS